MVRISSILTFFITLLIGAPGPMHGQVKQKGIDSIIDEQGNTSFGHIKNGKKSGEWCTTDKWGKILRTENFSEGKPNGVTIIYSSTNDTINLFTYRNGILHGLSYHFYRPNKREEGNYVEGRKQGWWVIHSRGTIPKIDSFYYVNDTLQGLHRFYDGDKLQQVEYYHSGLKHGRDTTFHYDTSGINTTGSWFHGKRNGIFYEYSYSGDVTRKTLYRLDTMCYDSAWVLDGTARILSRTVIYNEKGIKTYSEEFHGGLGPRKLTDRKYYYGQDGLIDSLYEYYAGALIIINYYDQNLPNELERGYHYKQLWFDAKGRLKCHGYKNQNFMLDKWIWLDSTGQVVKEIEYSPTGPRKYTCYYSNGKVKITGACVEGLLHDSIHVYSDTGRELRPGSRRYKQILVDQFKTEDIVRYTEAEVAPVNGGKKP